MEMKKLFLLLPIVLIVFTSGCTSLPFCIPFLNIGNCGVVEFEDDIIVISSLEALPQTVSPGQQIRVVTYVQNTGKDKVPQTQGATALDKIKDNRKVTVNMYDYCKGLFQDVGVECEGTITDCNDNNNEGCKCEISQMLPGQTKEVSWILKAGNTEDVPLKTTCDLKIAVTYPYKTTSLTDITFIDYSYMQHQINQGTFRKKGSYIVAGYGPIKPVITVEDQQPIPVQDKEAGKTVISLGVKDGGNGYLCRESGGEVICDSKIPKDNIEIMGIDGNLQYSAGGECVFNGGDLEDDVTLINKKSPGMICEIELDSGVNLPKETTEHITTSVEYLYEFRKDIKVTIEPKT